LDSEELKVSETCSREKGSETDVSRNERLVRMVRVVKMVMIKMVEVGEVED
jgi:hypothetical protein